MVVPRPPTSHWTQIWFFRLLGDRKQDLCIQSVFQNIRQLLEDKIRNRNQIHSLVQSRAEKEATEEKVQVEKSARHVALL